MKPRSPRFRFRFRFRFRSLLLLAATTPVAAQSRDPDPLATVQRLFDAMRLQDTAAMRATLDSDARLLATGTNQQGQPFARSLAIDGWLRGIAAASAKTDERIYEPEVRVAGDLATVWTRFDFFLGENFNHCGYDSFHLIARGRSWQIVQIADTHRRQADQCGRGTTPAPDTKPSAADTAAIADALKQMVDAIRARDSLAVKAAFHADAHVISTGDDGSVRRPVAEWARLIVLDRGPAARGSQEIRTSDNLATTWGLYDAGEGPGSHCGVMAAQLARTPAGWKVAHLTQTIAPPPCQLRR
jgi:hypothetical protein